MLKDWDLDKEAHSPEGSGIMVMLETWQVM
jgi:hypothetical protein